MEKEKICKNCGASYNGEYCPSCGQSSHTERLSVKEMGRVLLDTLLGVDNNLYRTIGSLFTRPGHMVREFLIGERSKYLKPVQMLLGLVTVYLLLSNFVFPGAVAPSVDMEKILMDNNQSPLLAKTLAAIFKVFQNRVSSTLLIAIIFAVPYTRMFRKFRITYKDGSEDSLNLAEHFNTLVYLACQGMVISYIYLPFRSIIHLNAGFVYNLALTVFLHTWCYKQLLGISWGKSLWRILVAGILMVTVLILLLILMFGIFYGLDPNV